MAGVSGGPRSGGSKGGDEGSGPAADGSHGSEAGGLSGGRAIFYRSNDRQEFMRERKDARDMKIYRSILALLGIPGPHLLTTRGETRLFSSYSPLFISFPCSSRPLRTCPAPCRLRNQDIERKRREDFEKKQQDDASREERLLQAMAEKQEENAKKSFQSLSPAFFGSVYRPTRG